MAEDKDNKKATNEAQQLYDLLQKINKEKAKLKKDPVKIADIGNLETAEALLGTLREQTEGFGEDVGYIVQDWTKVIGAVTKTSEAIRQSNKSLNTLRDISRQVANVQEGLTDMSSRELKKLGDKAKAAAAELQRNRELLTIKRESGQASAQEIEYLDKINAQLREQEDLVTKTNEAISEQARRQKNVEKSMGLTGLALGGIEGLLGKIGLSGIGDMFGEARDKAKEMADKVTEGGNKTAGLTGRLKILGAGFGSLLKSAWGFLNPLNLITVAIGGITKLFGHVKEKAEEGRQAVIPIADAVTNLSRDLGLAEGAAGKLAGAVAGAGPSFEASAASVGSIYKALGSTEKIAPNILKQFVQLNIYAGMSAESLSKFYKFSKLSGDNAGKVVKNMSDTALQQIKNLKLSTSMKGLLEEVSNVSDTVKIRFAGQEKALVKTVAMSKKLGVEMKKMEDMAKGLLNFEDSIAAEMEAELLTGKQLNLEKARELALQGKSEEAAKLLIEQAGGLQEFQQMNVVQQEAMAKAIGMSRDEMAGMLVKQKENVSLQGDLVDGQKDGQAAMKSGMSASEKEAARQRAAQADSMKYYNRLAPVMEKLEGIWNKIKGHLFDLLDKNVLKPFMDWFNSPAGKEFFNKTLPRGIDKLFKFVQNAIDKLKSFVKDHPTFVKILAGGIAGFQGLKVLGLDEPLKNMGKGLIEKFTGVSLGKKDGSSPQSAMFVQDVNSNALGDSIASAFEKKGEINVDLKGKSKFSKGLNKFGSSFSKLTGRFGKFGGVLGKLVPKLGVFGGFLKGLGPKIMNMFSGLMPKLGNMFGGFFSKAGGFLKGMGSKALGGLKSAGSTAGGFLKGVGSKVFGGLKSAGKSIVNVASKLNPASLLKNGLLGKAAKFIGKAVKGGGLMSVLLGAADLASILTDSSLRPLDKAKKIIPSASGAIGSVLGSVAGSVLGPIGTFAGGTLGSLAGQYIGESKPIQEALAPPLARALGGEEVAADFISRPGMPVQKFRADDIIVGGTKLLGGNSKEQQYVIKLLEKLVMLVEKGGDIHIDGSKVGKAVVMNSSRIR